MAESIVDTQLQRTPSQYKAHDTFILPPVEERSYEHQFADTYFLRLAQLKSVLELEAERAWAHTEILGEKPKKVERVLDVRRGEFSWVTGTVYVDMELKPNVLDDVLDDGRLAIPTTPEKYFSADSVEKFWLEDESGRLELVGTRITTAMLVTGCVVAVIGSENLHGEFDVVDIRTPGLANQPVRWSCSESPMPTKQASRPNKIALLSGLCLNGSSDELLTLDVLTAFLLGESGDRREAVSASHISRLIIAGDSLAAPDPTEQAEDALLNQEQQDPLLDNDVSNFNAAPPDHLDAFLADLLPSLPITLMPGARDPANPTMPQQPMHAALLSAARSYGAQPRSMDDAWLDTGTNPLEAEVDGWIFMGNSGQPLDDVFRYQHDDNRLRMMEHMLQWRVAVPTAPDTLWSYPFDDRDPFVMGTCPHVYFAGNQPEFGTKIIEGPQGQQVRLVMIPSFKESRQIVLVDADTLEAEVVQIEVFEEK